MLAVGENGAGKTNLLEALHVGTQGFSPRRRNDAQLVRFGAEAARIELAGRSRRDALEVELTLRPGEAKRARLNGAALRAAEQLAREVATLVFTPDRLVVVKGGPAARRAYFDRTLGPAVSRAPAFPLSTRLPSPSATRLCGGSRSAFVAGCRRALDGARRRARRDTCRWPRSEAIELLSSPFAERAAELGLSGADLYEAEPPTVEALEARLDEDLDRGTTGLGPHLDDVGIAADGRDLRRFGSQGEQRLAVLSLLLAEAELLAERGPAPPLLLLDDVLSELDERRRRALAERLAGVGQAFITATGSLGAAGRAGPARRGRPGEVRDEAERIGDEVQRELSRFGPAEGMTEIVRAWPEAMGEQIARNAWPARLSRDGKLHVATSSSAWAFELAQLEPKLLERLSEALGDRVPEGLRFAPGKLPEPPSGGGPTSPRSIGKPTQSDLDTAAELTAAIDDESLRKIVAKAAAASLSRGR